MIIRRVTAPATLPITLDEVKAQLRITHDAEDTFLNGLIAAAVDYVDGQGLLGRAMITQTWAQYVSQSPGWVRLEMGPFIALVSVEYYDDAGVLQTATVGDFEAWLQDDFVICKPKENREWPTADTRQDAIKITYTAGFGTAADVPASLKHALLLLVSHWYQNREASIEAALKEIPLGFDMLLNAHRVSWYG
jgi:uncharacterized phiE125 gp8 family phage protein